MTAIDGKRGKIKAAKIHLNQYIVEVLKTGLWRL